MWGEAGESDGVGDPPCDGASRGSQAPSVTPEACPLSGRDPVPGHLPEGPGITSLCSRWIPTNRVSWRKKGLGRWG